VAPPTRREEQAARVLDQLECQDPEKRSCGVQLYAVGTVALRGGRLDGARAAFLRACDVDRGWCARAAQEQSLPWTPAERERLARRASR